MPRQSRLVLPDCPHHIIQRGHNRQAVFAGEEDYRYYLENLREWKQKLGCKVYAYCLMTNHVHLIIDPGEHADNLALLMKRIAGRQTRFVNHLEARTGSLWEGRYKSSPIAAADYLLACCRYVEMNPVRAGMTATPWEYAWSSCAAKTGLRPQDWLDIDPFYQSLGTSPAERAESYRRWLLETTSQQELDLIRTTLQRGQPTGSLSFAKEISEKLGRRVVIRGRGRPKK